MPPKAAVGGGASGLDAEAQLLPALKRFLENERPPLSAEEYEALIPRHTEGPHWSGDDEEELQAQGKFAEILRRGTDVWIRSTGARQLWRVFAQVYRCLPTELFSWAYQIDADTNKNPSVSEGPHVGAPNIIWSNRFCNELKMFTMHGFWTYNKDWDFPVMAQLMQLAVICRKNDCRPWQLVNHTEDPFFTELANEIQREAGVRSIKDLIDSVEARMNARNRRPSEFRVLCRGILTKCFRPDAAPLVDGVPGPYKVTLDDLQALVHCLDRLSPCPGLRGISIGWTGHQWMTSMEKAQGSGKGARQAQPVRGDLLARAIAFGLMGRERDEKISQRSAEGMLIPSSPDIQPNPEQPRAVNNRDPSSDNEEEEDHADYLVWMRQTKNLETFRRNMSPDPTRGRCDRGPFGDEPYDDGPEFWNAKE